MSVKFRDYYDVLGVARDATQDQIRKAFRKLARKYHPDTAEDKSAAEEKFKEINEAYEVLGDPEKRKKYDNLGRGWQHGSDFDPGGGFPGYGAEGFDFGFGGTTGFSDFFESVFGQRAQGADPFHQTYGEARTRNRPNRRAKGRDIESDLLVSLDEVMTGATRQLRLRRPNSVQGRPPEEITLRIHVPKGIREGQLIRCAGMGEPGHHGGEAGDLLLRAKLEWHPTFQLRGSSDLTRELPLAPWECVLGSTVKLDTLHGAVNLKVPAGTQTGTEFRLRGKGLPKGEEFGDLYAIVKVAVPKKVSEEEAKLWAQLSEKSAFKPR